MLDLDSYFERIGYSGPRTPTLETLRALQAAPSARDSVREPRHARGPARAARSRLARAQARAEPPRRLLLRAEPAVQARARARSGSTSTALAARVVWERPADELRARTHMVLLVALGGERYVCDVGFGGLTPTAPVEPRARRRAADAARDVSRRARRRASSPSKRTCAASGSALYRFDLQEQQQVDIELLNHYVMSHAESPMRGRLLAARVAADRRFGLGNGVLSIHHLRRRDASNGGSAAWRSCAGCSRRRSGSTCRRGTRSMPRSREC